MLHFLSSMNAAKAVITKAYLGLDKLSDSSNPLIYSVSQTVNILPLLAYQKIYYDFFSESQWEKHLAYAYNVDYWDGRSQLSLAPEMLQIRYANYPKDYFMGMLPSSQYGSVAVLLVLLTVLVIHLFVILLTAILCKQLRLILVVPIDYFVLILTFPPSQSVLQNISSVGKK